MRPLTQDEITKAFTVHADKISKADVGSRMMGSLDKQRAYVLGRHSMPIPCPICREPVPIFLAACARHSDSMTFVSDPDDTPIIVDSDDRYTCPYCCAKLQHVVPFIGVSDMWRALLTNEQVGMVKWLFRLTNCEDRTAFVRELQRGPREQMEEYFHPVKKMTLSTPDGIAGGADDTEGEAIPAGSLIIQPWPIKE